MTRQGLRAPTTGFALIAAALLLVFLQPVAPAQAAPTTARDLLNGLATESEVRTGYDRDLFNHWIDADGNGCNTRAEVLIAESQTAVTRTGTCTITSGRWYSPYDQATWTNPSDVDIDHMVPLAEAWDSGARGWTAQTRTAFANDLGLPDSLIAVTDSVNQSKSDQDPAEWMPSNAAYTCDYVTAWIRVKYRWDLSVDPAERSALTGQLNDNGCGDRAIEAPARSGSAQQAYTFTDVPQSYIWSEQVAWLAGAGITTGYVESDGTRTFRPTGPILREQMAAFLYRLAGAGSTATSCGLIDVPPTHTFAKEICWLRSEGVTTGYAVAGGTEFRGSQPVLREQMAAFIRRFSGEPGTSPSSPPFTDVQPGHTFYNDIAWLAANGISTGYDSGYGCRVYSPSAAIQRGDMAAFLYRFGTGNTATPIHDGSGCQPPVAPPPPPPPADPGVYYANCDAVRAAGRAPLYRGQPGYRAALDRDNDGIACE